MPVFAWRSALESDVIIELADGRWAAIEIEVGENKVPAAVENLNHLEEKGCSNPRAEVRPPEFRMVLVDVSEYARKAGDRTYVVPVRLLGEWSRRAEAVSKQLPSEVPRKHREGVENHDFEESGDACS